MGADMLLACIGEPPRRPGVKLDWDAGEKVIRQLTTDELESDPELEFRTPGDDDAENRRAHMLTMYASLKQVLGAGDRRQSRDICSFRMFGWWIHFTGGETSGDDPTYSYEIFEFFGAVVSGEKILNAVGLAYPPHEMQAFTIEEQPT